MHPSERANTYRIATSLLPEEGLYTVEANVSGAAKNKKSQSANSQKIKYLVKKESTSVSLIKSEKTHEGKEIELKSDIKQEDKNKEEQTPGSGIYFGLITIWNLAAAGAAFVLFKKASAGPQVVIPVFEDPEITRSAIIKLKEKLSVTEINLSDPIFSGEVNSKPIEESKPQVEQSGTDLTAAKEVPTAEAPAADVTEQTPPEAEVAQTNEPEEAPPSQQPEQTDSPEENKKEEEKA